MVVELQDRSNFPLFLNYTYIYKKVSVSVGLMRRPREPYSLETFISLVQHDNATSFVLELIKNLN